MLRNYAAQWLGLSCRRAASKSILENLSLLPIPLDVTDSTLAAISWTLSCARIHIPFAVQLPQLVHHSPKYLRPFFIYFTPMDDQKMAIFSFPPKLIFYFPQKQTINIFIFIFIHITHKFYKYFLTG